MEKKILAGISIVFLAFGLLLAANAAVDRGNPGPGPDCMILDLLSRLNREENRTLILVTHDPRIAEHADRIIKLQDGNII